MNKSIIYPPTSRSTQIANSFYCRISEIYFILNPDRDREVMISS